ncbi:hypothetical protein GCM10011607_29570 [Shewanella inventionis]|uniref:Uncharacterized protein n=1 Tax=Shewanella inventionis TaxID=1738770 RepID=A0ABQ1JFE9_9GAMM|nr:hypothetical protein GCM10011607_29570 [Shewanella inventionis]
MLYIIYTFLTGCNAMASTLWSKKRYTHQRINEQKNEYITVKQCELIAEKVGDKSALLSIIPF